MKNNLFLIIMCFSIGACMGGAIVASIQANEVQEKEHEINEIQSTLDKGRNTMIEFNKNYNAITQELFILSFVDNNQAASFALNVLNPMGQKIIELNKSFGIDCKQYNEDGSVLMIESEHGRSPLETIPKELRIMD